MNWDLLEKSPRLLLEAHLQPVAGSRFQPTGFADLGAAEYTLPGGLKMLLVESAQSVANRLEKTCLDGDGPDLDPTLSGLSYVAVELEGDGIQKRTSSLVEAHRIASPYIILNKEFNAQLVKEMAYNPKQPLDWQKIYSTLFKYDANSLIHGVFLSLLEGGRVRAPRAITGFIEASQVSRVVSGGVKNSPVDPTGKTQLSDPVPTKSSESGIYSNVPYSRVEYVAGEIKAYFNLDLALIRGYRLGPDATRLIIALSLLKVRRFLDSSLRLRTACDFELSSDVHVKAPLEFIFPSAADLLTEVRAGINACTALFAIPPVTVIRASVKIVEKTK